MDKNVARAIAQYFRALRRVRGKEYSLVSLYESELKGALSILHDLSLISLDDWDRLQRLASKLALRASGCGWHSVRQYNAARASRSSATSSEKVVQDEPASEQIFASEAPSGVSVRGVLVPRAASGKVKKTLLTINLLFDEDGDIVLDRTAFPRLGKHWAPASILVGYQERKGNAFFAGLNNCK